MVSAMRLGAIRFQVVHMNISGLRPAFGFGGLEPEHADYKNARYAVLPVPYDSTTSYKVGTREGPQAIIAASMNMELYDIETGSNPFEAGIVTLPPVEPDMGSPARFVKSLQRITGKLLKDGKFPIILGGEHSISFGPIAACLENLNRSSSTKKRGFTVVQIDAHSDLRSDFEGTPFNHACVMRRVREDLGLGTVHVGIRSYCEEEAEYIKKHKVPVFHAHDVAGKLVGCTKKIIDAIGTDDVYLSIDIDGLDPSIVPATGTPEPGGLLWYETLHFIKELVCARRIVGFDLVELMPIPGNHASDFLAAKFVYKIIAYLEKYAKKR